MNFGRALLMILAQPTIQEQNLLITSAQALRLLPTYKIPLIAALPLVGIRQQLRTCITEGP